MPSSHIRRPIRLLYKTIRLLGNRFLIDPPRPLLSLKLNRSRSKNSIISHVNASAASPRFKSQIMTTTTTPNPLSTTATMDGLSLKATPSSSSQTSRSVIVRYISGEERFQIKLMHKNKIFNFDRSVTDSLQALTERMVANLSKKMKTWDGVVALLTCQNNNHNETGGEFVEILDKSIPITTLLRQVMDGECQLSIKISEEVYDVVVNPPEILSIKFLKQAVVGCPIIPYKIETSSNFERNSSRYLWEFTMDPKKVETPPTKKKNQQNKKKNSSSEECWESTGCTDFIITPRKELIGARLRLTCVPCSNASSFGLPYSEEVPEVVAAFPVEKPLFMERMEGILKEAERRTIADVNNNDRILRFVSYNCLAECYATEEWFISSPKSALPAEFRLPFLCQEFAAYQGDVYCLQEIEDKYFERIFTPFFECTFDYKGLFSPKTGTVKEGVAMFYNPQKLKLLKNETVVIMEHLKTMPIWSKIPDPVVQRITERNSVLQVGIFRAVSQEDTIIIIANTHLYFHPDADHIRMLQTATCVDFIETVVSEIKNKWKGVKVAVMFCGDYNCTPPYSSFRYLTSGLIQEDDFDWTSHPTEKLEPGLSLQHNLQLTNSHPEHELTNITTCFEGCIDYILYQSQNFDLVATYPPPDKTTIANLCNLTETRLVSLPNLHTPSDHLPLIADFKLKQQD